jgi:hypothetical protein
MPRDGSGQYSQPFPNVVEGTTIESAVYNGYTADVTIDLNTPRPIVAGGTGANNAHDAMINLKGEVAHQIVTNYDSHIFVSGSFESNGATGQPTPGLFLGVAVVNQSAAFATLSGRTTAGVAYNRNFDSGAWGPWLLQSGSVAEADARYVNSTGDTMTGALIQTGAVPSISLRKNTGGAGNGNDISGYTSTTPRWLMRLGDTTPESGGNSGSDFALIRFNDAGAQSGTPLAINRIDGKVSLAATSVNDGGLSATQRGQAGCLWVDFAGPGVDYGLVLGNRTAGAVGVAAFVSDTNAIVGTITHNGTATAYNTSSDVRLKQDLQSFDAGNIVDNTNVYNFAWKGAPSQRAYGVTAQEANEVYPAAVFHDETQDWWGVDYSKYVPVLLQELKSLRARVSELEILAGIVPDKPAIDPK